MSLFSLLLSLLSALPMLSEIKLPESAAVQLPAREVELVPQRQQELTAREEECLMAAVQYRCGLVGLRGVQVRRCGQHYCVRVEGGVMKSVAEYTEVLDDLEMVLNERTSLQLLRVHPRSEVLVDDGEVQELLVAYETAMVAYEEGIHPGASAPPMPELPHRLRAEGYGLVEYHVVSPEDGSSRYEYMVVQRPEAAAEEDLLVTELEVESAQADVAREGVVDVQLTQRGADILGRLTGGMEPGHDRLAILLNGRLVCAPVVHAQLGASFIISGLEPQVIDSVIDGLARPLPVPVKVLERRRVGE